MTNAQDLGTVLARAKISTRADADVEIFFALDQIDISADADADAAIFLITLQVNTDTTHINTQVLVGDRGCKDGGSQDGNESNLSEAHCREWRD